MPRTDRLRWQSHNLCCALVGAFCLVMGAATAKPANAISPSEVCRHPGVRKKVSELVGRWSQHYPFARVIIGDDGRLGEISEPRVVGERTNAVICLASYYLVKPKPTGGAYIVSISKLPYVVTLNPKDMLVELPDLPVSLEGTNTTMADLIARFTVDGRPYSEVLEANRRRNQN